MLAHMPGDCAVRCKPLERAHSAVLQVAQCCLSTIATVTVESLLLILSVTLLRSPAPDSCERVLWLCFPFQL